MQTCAKSPFLVGAAAADQGGADLDEAAAGEAGAAVKLFAGAADGQALIANIERGEVFGGKVAQALADELLVLGAVEIGKEASGADLGHAVTSMWRTVDAGMVNASLSPSTFMSSKSSVLIQL